MAGELGMRSLVAHCHFQLSKVYGKVDQQERAGDHLTTAMAMSREIDMRFWLTGRGGDAGGGVRVGREAAGEERNTGSEQGTGDPSSRQSLRALNSLCRVAPKGILLLP